MHRYILFLDFDGVLHRGTSGTFRHAQALAEALAGYPAVRIVISSDWRLSHTLSDLLDWLPNELAIKVVGVTPFLPESTPAVREQEALLWLQTNPARNWIFIDDKETLFSKNCLRLLKTDSREGLTPYDLTQLQVRLSGHSSPT